MSSPGIHSLEAIEQYGFSDDQEEAVVESFRLGGLTYGEIEDVLERAWSYIEDLEGQETSIFDYASDLDSSEMDFHNFMECMPVLITYLDSEDPYELGVEFSTLGDVKRSDYWLRTAPVWEDELSTEQKNELAGKVAENQLFGKKKLFSQYIQVLKNFTSDADLQDYFYSEISNDRAKARALAGMPAEEFPFEILGERFSKQLEAIEDPLQVEGVLPRLRKLRGAGSCPALEKYYLQDFLGDDPSKNATVIGKEGELLGVWSMNEETQSFLSFRNAEEGGRYPLLKGMIYRGGYPVWSRINQAQEVDGWNVLEIDNLDKADVFPVGPMRELGAEDKWMDREEGLERIEDKFQQFQSLVDDVS